MFTKDEKILKKKVIARKRTRLYRPWKSSTTKTQNSKLIMCFYSLVNFDKHTENIFLV